MEYIALQDFSAGKFVFDKPMANSPVISFKKGDMIDLSEKTDFSMHTHLVTPDGFDVPASMVSAQGSVISVADQAATAIAPVVDNVNKIISNNKAYLTPNNITVGLLILLGLMILSSD